jgi:hypothetical protein
MFETEEIDQLGPNPENKLKNAIKAKTKENNQTLAAVLWNRFRELSAESSVHAYHNINKTKLALLRFAWFVLFLASLGFCAFLVIGTIRTYTSYSVTTTTRIKQSSSSDGSMAFPVISFCNAKPYMTRAAFDYAIDQFKDIYGNASQIPDQITSVLYHNYTDPNIFSSFYNVQV